MPNVLVREVPDEVHLALQRRARARGQSLQQFLLSELRLLARRRSVDEILAEVETHHGGRVGLAEAVDDLDAERRALGR